MQLTHFIVIACTATLFHNVVRASNYEEAFYEALEKALVNKENVYKLQKEFYPHNTTEPIFLVIVLIRERFNIHANNSKYNGSGFVQDGDSNCYRRAKMCGEFHCKSDTIELVSTNNFEYLNFYISKYNPLIKIVDGTFYTILSKFTNHLIQPYGQNYSRIEYIFSIDIDIYNLTFIPDEDDVIKALETLFSWAKYYARTGHISGYNPREESDRWYATVVDRHKLIDDINTYSFNEDVHYTSLICLIVFLNLSIMLWGFYILYYLYNRVIEVDTDKDSKKRKVSESKESKSEKTENKMIVLFGFESDLNYIKRMFNSSSAVMLLVNICCFIANIYLVANEPLYGLNYGLTCAFVVFEFYVTTRILHQNMGKCSCELFRFSVAICSILWFSHRIGNCFIVSIYFIAISPTQTITVITLCLSVIIAIIASLSTASTYFNNSANFNRSMLMIVIYALFLALTTSIALIFFTIIFVDLTQHGLSASQLGSILLALAIPTLMIALTFFIERQNKDRSMKKKKEAQTPNEEGEDGHIVHLSQDKAD